MFDPFRDDDSAGYLRNVLKLKHEAQVKRMEHAIFVDALPEALDYLASRDVLTYADFLETHRVLFSEFYPWAGRERSETAPNTGVSKGDILFAHPSDAKLAVDEGLRLGQMANTMALSQIGRQDASRIWCPDLLLPPPRPSHAYCLICRSRLFRQFTTFRE